MAYNGDYLSCVGNLGGKGGGNIWIYKTVDPIETVDGTDYFSDGIDKGMALGDVVTVIQVTTLPNTTPTEVTLGVITAVSTDGATLTQMPLA